MGAGLSGVEVGGHQEVEAKAQDYQDGGNCHEFPVLMFYHFSPLLISSVHDFMNKATVLISPPHPNHLPPRAGGDGVIL